MSWEMGKALLVFLHIFVASELELLPILPSSLVPAQNHKNSKSSMIHAVLMEKTMVAGYKNRTDESEAH